MHTRRDFGDDAAVDFVELDLRRDRIGQHNAAVIHNRGAGFVAGRFYCEYTRVACAYEFSGLFARDFIIPHAFSSRRIRQSI